MAIGQEYIPIGNLCWFDTNHKGNKTVNGWWNLYQLDIMLYNVQRVFIIVVPSIYPTYSAMEHNGRDVDFRIFCQTLDFQQIIRPAYSYIYKYKLPVLQTFNKQSSLQCSYIYEHFIETFLDGCQLIWLFQLCWDIQIMWMVEINFTGDKSTLISA